MKLLLLHIFWSCFLVNYIIRENLLLLLIGGVQLCACRPWSSRFSRVIFQITLSLLSLPEHKHRQAFHITKLLVDWRQNVLADALYLLMKDGCDRFKILNSELQVLKPLNSVVGISNSQHSLSLSSLSHESIHKGKKKKTLIRSFHFF